MEARTKALLIVFSINFLAMSFVMARSIRSETNTKPLPTLKFEDLGEAYANWEFLHASFIVPFRKIVSKSKENLHHAENITSSFRHTEDHLQIRVDVLNNTIRSIEIEFYGLDGTVTRVKRDMNIDLEVDVVATVNAIFAGISNLFHAPQLNRLKHNQESIIKVINCTTKMLKFVQREQIDINHDVGTLFKLISNYSEELYEDLNKLNGKVEDLAKINLVGAIVEDSIDNLEVLINAVPFLLNNR